MTNQLQGDKYINLHLVWPSFHKLKSLLADTHEDRISESDGLFSVTTSMKLRGRSYMSKNHADFSPTFHHKAMTFLNPAMKKLNVLSTCDRLLFHDEIERYILKHFPSEVEINVTNEESYRNERIAESFIAFDDDGNTDSEMMRYIHHPIQSEVNLKKWWFENSNTYPTLFKLFMKLSCIPATTASSERAFSAGGNIITNKRSMILPKHVNNLIVLRNKV